MAEGIFKELKEIEENRFCFECGNGPTTWASSNLGVFLCLQCAGLHRNLGVQYSFVRSLALDDWKDWQLYLMKIGGNQRAKEFFEFHDLMSIKDLSIRYSHEMAQRYREILQKEVSQVFGQDLRKNISSSSSFKNKSLKMYSGVKSISSDSYFHTIDEKSILHENDFNNSSNTCCNCCTIL